LIFRIGCEAVPLSIQIHPIREIDDGHLLFKGREVGLANSCPFLEIKLKLNPMSARKGSGLTRVIWASETYRLRNRKTRASRSHPRMTRVVDEQGLLPSITLVAMTEKPVLISLANQRLS